MCVKGFLGACPLSPPVRLFQEAEASTGQERYQPLSPPCPTPAGNSIRLRILPHPAWGQWSTGRVARRATGLGPACVTSCNDLVPAMLSVLTEAHLSKQQQICSSAWGPVPTWEIRRSSMVPGCACLSSGCCSLLGSEPLGRRPLCLSFFL